MSTCARAASSVRVGLWHGSQARWSASAIVVIAIAAGPSAATFSGKNGRISFARSVGNHTEIFSANPDGSHKTRLTVSKPRGATSFISDWSPDGQLIAFDSDRTDVDGRKHPVQIYVMAWNGTGVTQLTRGGGFHGFPGWSPSGTTMAIDSDWGKRSLNGIWIIPASDPDGVTVAEAQRVTDARAGGAKFDSEPQFSPDGTTIVFSRFKSFRSSKSAIFRVNVDGTGLERLTNYRLNASHPDVSPDGQWITFDSGDSGLPGTKGDIYVMPHRRGQEAGPDRHGARGGGRTPDRRAEPGLLAERAEDPLHAVPRGRHGPHRDEGQRVREAQDPGRPAVPEQGRLGNAPLGT